MGALELLEGQGGIYSLEKTKQLSEQTVVQYILYLEVSTERP